MTSLWLFIFEEVRIQRAASGPVPKFQGSAILVPSFFAQTSSAQVTAFFGVVDRYKYDLTSYCSVFRLYFFIHICICLSSLSVMSFLILFIPIGTSPDPFNISESGWLLICKMSICFFLFLDHLFRTSSFDDISTVTVLLWILYRKV